MMQAQSEKIQAMKQATLNLDRSLKKTRKREYLEQMAQVVSWADLVEKWSRKSGQIVRWKLWA